MLSFAVRDTVLTSNPCKSVPCRHPASSARWRSLRPLNVLLSAGCRRFRLLALTDDASTGEHDVPGRLIGLPRASPLTAGPDGAAGRVDRVFTALFPIPSSARASAYRFCALPFGCSPGPAFRTSPSCWRRRATPYRLLESFSPNRVAAWARVTPGCSRTRARRSSRRLLLRSPFEPLFVASRGFAPSVAGALRLPRVGVGADFRAALAPGPLRADWLRRAAPEPRLRDAGAAGAAVLSLRRRAAS